LIRFGLVLLWALLLLVTRTSQAQIPVVIVVPHTGASEYDAYEHCLRSELVASGLQPVSVEVPAEIDTLVLKAQARHLMSPAAISLSIHDQVVSGVVWIQARGTNGDSLRSVPDYPLGEQAPTVFAVRATDVLHGGLLELGYLGSTPEPPVVQSRPAETPQPIAGTPATSPPASTNAGTTTLPTPPKPTGSAQTEPARLGSEHGGILRPWQSRIMVTLSKSLAGYPSNVGFTLSGMRHVHQRFRLGLSGTCFAPVVARTMPDEGRAYITQVLIGARLEYLQPLTETITTLGYLETGPHAIFVSSEATSLNTAHRAHSYTGYSMVGLGVNWRTSTAVRLAVETGLLLPWKAADVLVLQAVVAEAARPTLLLNVGIQLSFQ
jgi:hypothetical protein